MQQWPRQGAPTVIKVVIPSENEMPEPCFTRNDGSQFVKLYTATLNAIGINAVAKVRDRHDPYGTETENGTDCFLASGPALTGAHGL